MANKYALDDMAQLHKDAQKAIGEQLAPGEGVKVVIPGNANDALVATDRRILIFDWGLLSKKLTTYDYRNITGVELQTGLAMGTLTVQAAGVPPKAKGELHGPNELSVMRTGYDRAREGVTALRHLISEHHAAPATAAQPDIPDQLRKLGELRDAGVLTPEEFNAKKGDLLARM